MSKKKDTTGRMRILGKLAARAGMTIEDWTEKLQVDALRRFKLAEPARSDVAVEVPMDPETKRLRKRILGG